MRERRVLVVGTTSDYIAYIHERYPGRVLFLTDISEHERSAGERLDDRSEIVCNLVNKTEVISELRSHISKYDVSLSGIACFDCEWLRLASELAEHFGLPFPSPDSIRLTRDKFLTKKAWAESGVKCPMVARVYSPIQALKLCGRFGGPVVLKPSTGSGSELTFRCDGVHDLGYAYGALSEGLARRSESPMYRKQPYDSALSSVEPSLLAERYVEGREYSADFVVEDSGVNLVRVAKKLRDTTLPFGTTLAYVVPATLPGDMTYDYLSEKLREAAHALGLTRAICMADFIIDNDEVIFLEMTPRIGGDCLPPLIRQACGLDTIGMALDFAEGRRLVTPPISRWKRCVGMRLFARQGGVLSGVNSEALSNDSRVREILVKRNPGHRIVLPPEDYDSWLLGHVIFEPLPDVSLRTQCNELKDMIDFHVEQCYDEKVVRTPAEVGREAHPASPSV